MTQRIFRVLIFGLVIISTRIYAQSSYKLQDFFESVDKNHPLAAQRDMIADKVSRQIKMANTSWYPSLSLGGQATYQSDITSIPSNGVFPTVKLPLDQYKVFVDLTQNLYEGNMTASQKKLIEAQSQVQLQKNQVDIYNLKQQVIQYYISIILTDKQALILKYAEDNLNTTLKTVENLKKNEMALPSDVNQIKSKLLLVEGQKLQIKYNRQTYLQNLETLCKVKIDSSATFELPMIKQESMDINRPELSVFEYQKNANDMQINTIKAKNRPKIGLFGTGAFGRVGLNLLNPNFVPYYLAGVRAVMPLSGLYTQKNEIQNIKIDNNLINNQKEIFNQNIMMLLQKNANEALQLNEQLKLDSKDIEYKTQILATYKAQFKENITLLKDYLDKFDELEQAQIQKNIHEIQLILNYLNRKFITGNLSL